jgi:hypothetical protein
LFIRRSADHCRGGGGLLASRSLLLTPGFYFLLFFFGFGFDFAATLGFEAFAFFAEEGLLLGFDFWFLGALLLLVAGRLAEAFFGWLFGLAEEADLAVFFDGWLFPPT